MAIDWKEVQERSRTYHFPGSHVVKFTDVIRVEVRESGKHRIETANGGKAFVAPGWFLLEIDTDEWTF